jgi:Ca2+-transporting ATPase
MNAWHAQSAREVLHQQASGDGGLDAGEAARRLLRCGANELPDPHRVHPLRMLLEQFRNVLVLILLAAAAISGFLGHGLEAVAIAVIVLFAVVLGFLQEFRAERALEAMRRMAAPFAHVRRSGVDVDIPSREVVPGDVLLLAAGDRVPADARLLDTSNLKVEESSLTGESVPVEKHAGAVVAAAAAIGDRVTMVYAGTAVAVGRGTAVAVATGTATEFGRISSMLAAVETGRTPLQENLDRVGNALAIGAFAIVFVIAAVGLARGEGLLEMFIFGVALAVAVVPEALPAVVTISLAIGVQRMVRRNALIRRLPAVETLGSTSVICSDKTGTLTRNEMTVRRLYVGGVAYAITGSGYDPAGELQRDGTVVPANDVVRAALRAGLLASDARLLQVEGRWEIRGDPTEAALVVAAAKVGLDPEATRTAAPRIAEVPFSSGSMRMTTLHRTADGMRVFVKGAPEVLIERCVRWRTAAGEEAFGDAERDEVRAEAAAMAGDALRVLALAEKATESIDDGDDGLVLLGLVGMIDPPRLEAGAAIATCADAGIRALMITGDHPATAAAIAREVGLLRDGRVVAGSEIDRMDDIELAAAVGSIDVFARVAPEHKLRVIDAWQRNGHIVAMTGDGVNDAPALKKADIGVAMGITGSDVSKEAAAMTLLDDNFASIVGAVEEGRGIYGNIKKYLMYLLSSNIGEMGLMAGATLAGLPLPLSAVQILYVNLATDGLPALALAVDPPEGDLMRRAPRDPRTGIFTAPVVALMVIGGVWSTIANVALFLWALAQRPLAEAMTLTFVSLVLIQFFKAYSFRSDRRSVTHRPFANRWLNRAVAWELTVLAAVLYVPLLQRAFGTFGLSPRDWGVVIAVAATVLPVLEAAKWAVRRGWFGRPE